MPRAKLRTPTLRATVITRAVQLLESEGAAAVTTRRVATLSGTSPPAIYEFFGAKEGLLRAVFFEGFAQLGSQFKELAETNDPRRDLEAVAETFRDFSREHPALCELMFSRPFIHFDPNREELSAGNVVRRFIVGRVKRCVDSGHVSGKPIDIAHSLLGLLIGLAAQERGGWLASSEASATRRWKLGVCALLDGFSTP